MQITVSGFILLQSINTVIYQKNKNVLLLYKIPEANSTHSYMLEIKQKTD